MTMQQLCQASTTSHHQVSVDHVLSSASALDMGGRPLAFSSSFTPCEGCVKAIGRLGEQPKYCRRTISAKKAQRTDRYLARGVRYAHPLLLSGDQSVPNR